MDVWSDLVGQAEIVGRLRRLVLSTVGEGAAEADISHAWLITGPAGSGRSNLAQALAAALLCPQGGCGHCASCTMVAAGTHPDLRLFRTDKVVIAIDDVRELVSSSYLSPSLGRMRVQLIEDADRMVERTSNVLLKSLEEPPATTVWILCAPSEADLLPTIRSRTAHVRLSMPSVEEVSSFLQHRDGVSAAVADSCARLAQCHIGMARRLALDSRSRERRDASLTVLLGIASASYVAKGAADLLAIAQEDAASASEADADRERAGLLRQLGLPDDQPVPYAYRAQLRSFEEDSKRRATRALRDGVDRILLDAESAVRDALLSRLGANRPLINVEASQALLSWASRRSPAQILHCMDAIAETRGRIAGNVPPLLAFEGMLTAFVDQEALR